MPGTSYTGVPANAGSPGSITSATAITETIPVDGDNDNAATFTVGLQKLADYLAYLFQGVFVGSGANPGLTGTGGATGPGVKAIPGGGGTPARGALALPSQTTPSAPVDGDAWYDGTNFFARVAGATKQVITAVSGILSRAQLPAVGQQTSSSSGAFSTTSATFVDATNLTVTITTTGRPVVLALQPDTSGTSIPIQSAASHAGAVQLLRGATVLGIWATTNFTGGNLQTLGLFLDAPAAGTYTYKVQAKGDGTGQIQVLNFVLVAYEL